MLGFTARGVKPFDPCRQAGLDFAPFSIHMYPPGETARTARVCTGKSMFAVIETGGKQYRVAQGQVLKVEKLDGAVGDTLTFDRVLMVGAGADVKIGRPYVEGATVTAELRALGRHPKIRIIKFRRRKHHQKQMGHRQHYAEIAITGIGAP